VLATRQNPRLGLHRLRLAGEVAEISADDLRFSMAQARELLAKAGVEVAEPALALLHGRTEGWAAGLRLAALGLAGHPDPERFAEEFSGGERTVAEYLLAEVLERHSEDMRRFLLRTSVLEQVSGGLADAVVGGSGGERTLLELQEVNAFVVSVDASRSWFRYHSLFADLLQLQLRRTVAADEVALLHRAAAEWFVAHGFVVAAIRHAQAAQDWDRAAELLADHWPGLQLDGQAGVAHELLIGFPTHLVKANTELAALAAADELPGGSLEVAERYLSLAEQGWSSMPVARQEQAQVLLWTVRLLLARHRGNWAQVVEAAHRLQPVVEATEVAQPGLGKDLRALALFSLGITAHWTARFADAVGHLELLRTFAERIGRPFLEFSSLAYQAGAETFASFTSATEHGTRAVRLATRHGWTDEPAAGVAYMVLAAVLAWQGRLAEAEPWIRRAERILRVETEPATGLAIHYVRGVLDMGCDRNADALVAFQAAERRATQLERPNLLVTAMRVFLIQALVRLGELERAERSLAELHAQNADRGEPRIAEAILRLAQDDPEGVTAALAPVLDGSAPVIWRTWLAQAFLLDAIARDALHDAAAAEVSLAHALDAAEPDGALLWFWLHPAPDLLDRHARHGTTHASLITDIRRMFTGSGAASSTENRQPVLEPLRESEIRVLRYLPTNLTAPEIARELSLSRNTIKTHMRNLYSKLGTHRRAEAVQRARALGLLAPSPRGR
jgi:LuxR family maltose regulon positive regulatory protein